MERVRIEPRSSNRHVWVVLTLTALCSPLLSGCQTVKIPEEQIAASNIPRELSKTTHPPHVIEPPDLIAVEVLEALPGRPILGERLVGADGYINLGFYGNVHVAGLTLDDAKEKIILHLRQYLNDSALGLVEWEDQEKGKVREIPPTQSNSVFVDLISNNSKYFYVLGDVAAPGRFPVTGNETVLDALGFAGGLTPTAAPQNIRLVRPAPPGSAVDQVLPVNKAAIENVGDTTTNYQLMPGDRVLVYRDPIVRTTVFLERLAAPFNTVVSTGLSFTFFKQSLRFLGSPVFGNTGATATSNNPAANFGGAGSLGR